MNPCAVAPVPNLTFRIVLDIAAAVAYLEFLELDIENFQVMVCPYRRCH